ncbi:MAG: MFS transporter [Phycisphaerae bacterium]
MPGRLKRYVVVAAAMAMLVCLGGSNGWGVFAKLLPREFAGLQTWQTQLVATTSVTVFCIAMIAAGRLHDRFGPRPLGVASGILLCAGYLTAWQLGASFFWLWLGIGVLAGLGAALGYVCPIATVVKWFPDSKGLACGLTAAGFAVGAIAMKAIAQTMWDLHWRVLDIFGLIGLTYGPVVLLAGLLHYTPRRQAHEDWTKFRRRTLLADRRFWLLFVGMFVGTYPYLTVMYNAEKIGEWFRVDSAAILMAISVVAVGNAAGRVFWGYIMEKIGTRASMLAAQAVAVVSMIAMLAWGSGSAVFLAAGVGVGFCYGSNFVIFPATIARQYGAHVLGSIYPLVMFAQGMSSFGPTVNGFFFDKTHSYLPGLWIALAVPAAGMAATAWLGRSAPAASTQAAVISKL